MSDTIRDFSHRFSTGPGTGTCGLSALCRRLGCSKSEAAKGDVSNGEAAVDLDTVREAFAVFTVFVPGSTAI